MITLSARQCRAARVGIDLSREELADLAAVAARTIADFESGTRLPQNATRAAIRLALESRGVRFLDDGCICLPEVEKADAIFNEENGDGPGVRLRKEKGKRK